MVGQISKVVTKTGDKGLTGLADGSRVRKNNLCIQVIGETDELNSLLGLIISLRPQETISNVLQQVQHQLFAVGSELSSPGRHYVTAGMVAFLEEQLDVFNRELLPSNGFILPGGTVIAAHIHIARTVCRRTERSLVALSEVERISPDLLSYLNRLSDLLFILAREANRSAGQQETLCNK